MAIAATRLMAQVNPAVRGFNTAASTDCSTSGSCVIATVSPNNGGAAVAISGTYSATNQFEGTVDGSNWAAITGVPLTVGTGVTSTTGTGSWQFSTSGLIGIRVRTSAFTSGAANITIQSGLNPPTTLSSSGAVTASQNLAQVGGNTVVTGGVNGLLAVGGAAASGAALSGNPVRIGASDGTNAVNLTVGNGNGSAVSGGVLTVVPSLWQTTNTWAPTGNLTYNTDGRNGDLIPADGPMLQGTSSTVFNRQRDVTTGATGQSAGIATSGTYVYNGTTFDAQKSGSATSTDPHFAAANVYVAGGSFTLQASGNATSTTTGTAKTGVAGFKQHILDFNVTAAERDSANETYDMYVQMCDSLPACWDVVHFTQIATTGAKQFIAAINCELQPQTITTAGPGVVSVNTATMKTDTGGSNEGTRTLAAGTVRHGVCGDRIRYDVVIAGTIGGTGLTFSITDTVR